MACKFCGGWRKWSWKRRISVLLFIPLMFPVLLALKIAELVVVVFAEALAGYEELL